MPATKKLPSLVEIALESLSDRILAVGFAGDSTEAPVRDWGHRLEELLSSQLENGVQDSLSRLLWTKLSLEYDSEVNAKKKRQRIRWILPSLLGPHFKGLNFSNCRMIGDKSLMVEVYKTFDSKCPNLERLSMGRSFFFKHELVAGLNQKLGKLSKLVSLKIMYIAVNPMITDISVNCPKLVELSLYGSSKIEDVSAEEISSCKNLSILDIQGTKISYVGCLYIIENCPNLEWVEHCPFNCPLPLFRTKKEMFELIKSNYEQNMTELITWTRNRKKLQLLQKLRRAKPFNIKNFWLINPKSDELRVSDQYPKLERIRLDFQFLVEVISGQLEASAGLTVLSPFVFTSTSALANFRYLDTLDLNFYDNYDNPLLDRILESCGSKLKTLIFNVDAEYRSIVDCHNMIARRCPNLTSLTFNEINETRRQDQDQETDGLLLRREADFQPHPKLLSLSLRGNCTDGRLTWLLAGSPHIRQISLDGNLERLSDSAWRDILADNQMQSLETLWFNSPTNMSMESVRQLVSCCPRLRRLGRLIHLREHAGGQRRENYLELVSRAARENWDTDITWDTPANRITF